MVIGHGTVGGSASKVGCPTVKLGGISKGGAAMTAIPNKQQGVVVVISGPNWRMSGEEAIRRECWDYYMYT